jgi:hypothetical protein
MDGIFSFAIKHMKRLIIPCISAISLVWLFAFTNVGKQEKKEASTHRTTTWTEERMMHSPDMAIQSSQSILARR